MKVEPWLRERVRPYDRNPRKNAGAVAKVRASIDEFGWRQPIVVDSEGVIVVGHTRWLAAGLPPAFAEVPVHVAAGLTPEQVRAYRLADNRTNEEAEWDEALLGVELSDLKAAGYSLGLTGFEDAELSKLLNGVRLASTGGADEIPEPPAQVRTRPGDTWRLGRHRVLCGDSTNEEQVARLIGDARVQLLHADPPYGMGKEADGVLNDNLYGAKLDLFQMAWWGAWRPYLEPNGSAYVWGNAPDLWRLWYLGGLAESEPLTLRNEIVWDKRAIAGMASDELTQFPTATERCLFFQLGRYVFLVGQTKEDYWPGWEPLRLQLCAERDRAGFSPGRVREIVQNHMYGHWFGTSQWVFISRECYAKLAAAADGRAFTKPYDDLRAEYEAALRVFRGEVRDPRAEEFRAGRPYFDNAHDIMRDVWEFPRVTGDERFGHATPKPVEMMERVLVSSLRAGENVAEPFAGTGSTLIAAERTNRRCFTMELDPAFVDVTVARWQRHTGEKAVRASDGAAFDELEPVEAAAA